MKSHVQQPDPRMKDPTLCHWTNTQSPSQTGYPLGLAQGQPLRTCFKHEDWPIPSMPTPTSAPTVKTEAPPQVAAILMPW